MNRTVIISIVFFVSTLSFAQLKVESNGHTIAGTKLMTYSTWTTGFQSGLSSTASFGYNYAAICGWANNTNSYGCAFGVYGIAENGAYGSNYGVGGALANGASGAGVIGSSSYLGSMGVNGTYAGYFNGATRVSGTLTVNNLVQTSDLRLKENIISLGNRYASTLDKILDMNVVEYNYKKILPSLILPDSISVEEAMKRAGIDPNRKHIGLIAQELRELYPNLVEESQDGYLAVNYVELVPVLIRAIQELKAELDAVKGIDTERRAPSITGVSAAKSDANLLYQNTPNPFKEQTIIRFSLADNVQDASICIFDMTGKTIKKLPISSGMESVSIGGYELGEGMFLYSLIINGQVIDTKRMVISK